MRLLSLLRLFCILSHAHLKQPCIHSKEPYKNSPTRRRPRVCLYTGIVHRLIPMHWKEFSRHVFEMSWVSPDGFQEAAFWKPSVDTQPISNIWRQNPKWHKFKFYEFLCFLETIGWHPTHFKYMAPKFKYVTQLQIQWIFVLFGIHRLTPMHWKLASCMFIIQLYICRYMYVYTYIYNSAQKASWNPSGDTRWIPRRFSCGHIYINVHIHICTYMSMFDWM